MECSPGAHQQQVRKRPESGDQYDSKINFSITGNDTLTFNDSTATLAGYGWVDIRKIQIEGGGELDVSWTGRNTWEARLPIKPGSETFTIEALNCSGQRVGSKTITIRNTSSTVPAEKGNLVISKIHFQPAAPSSSETAAGFSDASDFEYVELKNTGTQEINLANARFTTGINHSLPSHTLAPEEQAILARNRSALLKRFPELGSKLLSGEYGQEDSNSFWIEVKRLRSLRLTELLSKACPIKTQRNGLQN